MKTRLAVKMGCLSLVDEDEVVFTPELHPPLARACSANNLVRINSSVVPWFHAVTHSFHRRSRECTYGCNTHMRTRYTVTAVAWTPVRVRSVHLLFSRSDRSDFDVG